MSYVLQLGTTITLTANVGLTGNGSPPADADFIWRLDSRCASFVGGCVGLSITLRADAPGRVNAVVRVNDRHEAALPLRVLTPTEPIASVTITAV